MEQYHSICQHLYEATQIPALLVAQDGHVVPLFQNAGAGIWLQDDVAGF